MPKRRLWWGLMSIQEDVNGSGSGLDHVSGLPIRPDGAGMYLHWDGRRTYRTKMPVPRVLEPVQALSYGDEQSSNLIVEGDNLQVMVSLRPQYRSRVNVAYLDPPYNTGKNDFRYSDRRFQDPNADSDDAVYVSNEDGGRHTKWLNYMGPRLWLVWELLADDGVCFVSINDVELFRLGMLMDEIFGEANKLGVIVWKQAIDNNPTRIVTEHEYVLVYAKDKGQLPTAWVGLSAVKDWLLETYERLHQVHGDDVPALARDYKKAISEHMSARNREVREKGESELLDLGRAKRYNRVDKRGAYAGEDATHNPRPGGYDYDVMHPVTGKVCKKPSNGYRFPEKRMRELIDDDRIDFGKDENQLVKIKKYVAEMSGSLKSVISLDARIGTNLLKQLLPEERDRFVHPKPVELIEQFIDFAGNTDALVLDAFAGSGTTGHAVLRLNARDGGRRRFILVEEGQRDDRYCRTLTAGRMRAAIEKESLLGGFTFLETGRRLNREAILDLERETITNLIIQTDVTGTGGGLVRVDGDLVIAHNARREAICLQWQGRSDSTITRDVLVRMFQEAKSLHLKKPLRVYGSTCDVGETDSFRFCQIPDEIVAALSLSDEVESSSSEAIVEAAENLEAISQELESVHGR
jgi:adenine-specific DNA-methyltransferase